MLLHSVFLLEENSWYKHFAVFKHFEIPTIMTAKLSLYIAATTVPDIMSLLKVVYLLIET